ncbi:glycosyltransferase family 4 protein [Candidatus Parcubacteria bacterium]|nr:glycosyltransferase family 4 protein [Candidatus Parcubacteria bacterium]
MTNENKLRIAIVASNVMHIPPEPIEKYVPKGWSGAPESIASILTEELVTRGHDVTLFASGDSQTRAKLVSIAETATSATPYFKDHRDYEHALISKAYQMAAAGKFDILHSHFDVRTAGYAPLVSTPTVSTLHGPLSDHVKNILQHFKKSQYYISISDAQRKPLPGLQYISTVYNGIDVEAVPFSDKKEDYLVFAGRIHEQKGVVEAIEAAKKANCKLLIFGSHDPESDYWLGKVKPLIDQKQIIYKGFVSKKELYPYYAKARAFIFPIQWEEPFGLVVAEAMATGTPVIALKKGSMPELVEDGKTGFVCDTVEQMAEAVKKVGQINPVDCRQRVEGLFTIEKMIDGYEKAYYDILNQSQ